MSIKENCTVGARIFIASYSNSVPGQHTVYACVNERPYPTVDLVF